MAYLISELGKEMLLDVERFCEEKVKNAAPQYDKSGEWPEELYEEAFALGYQTLEIPEKYGGLGIGEVEKGAIFEAFGKADGGFAVTLAAGNLAMEPVLYAGSEELKEEMCQTILSGGVGAFCLTEPDAGSDVAGIRTSAKKVEDGYILDGRKCFVTNGAHAVFYCVAAKVEEEDGEKLSFFYVRKGQEGITVEKHEDKMGIRLSETCDVVFDHCKVENTQCIGKIGDGFSIAMNALNKGRILMAAVAVGIAQRALEEGIRYAKKRKQFGKSVLSNQGMRFKIADMEIKIETARQMTAHGLQCIEKGLSYEKEASIAKCYSADIAVEVTQEAIQMMGGYGYSRELPAEKLMRDAKIFQIFEGTNEIQRIIIAKKVLEEQERI